MEEMNNNLNNEPITPVAENNPIPPVVETPPKQNNIFKTLFLITFLTLIGTLITILFLINKKPVNQEQVNNNIPDTESEEALNNIDITPMPEISVTPTPIDIKFDTYQIKSIEDDENSITKLVLIDGNKKETIISESNYSSPWGGILKPTYKVILSPDYNYFYYISYFGGKVGLYSVKDSLNIALPYYDHDVHFLDSNDYFYGCSEHGIINGGAIIFDLKKHTPIYQKEGSFKCTYNSKDNSLSLTEDFLISGEKKTELFSFTTGSFIN